MSSPLKALNSSGLDPSFVRDVEQAIKTITAGDHGFYRFDPIDRATDNIAIRYLIGENPNNLEGKFYMLEIDGSIFGRSNFTLPHGLGYEPSGFEVVEAFEYNEKPGGEDAARTVDVSIASLRQGRGQHDKWTVRDARFQYENNSGSTLPTRVIMRVF